MYLEQGRFCSRFCLKYFPIPYVEIEKRRNISLIFFFNNDCSFVLLYLLSTNKTDIRPNSEIYRDMQQLLSTQNILI